MWCHILSVHHKTRLKHSTTAQARKTVQYGAVTLRYYVNVSHQWRVQLLQTSRQCGVQVNNHTLTYGQASTHNRQSNQQSATYTACTIHFLCA